ncbi:phage portal protein [Rhodobacter capsulatus]|uniref:phage portal protein n=1 Tax=Rhodobacter capsulatus TaxID=1061 RepID=UPI004029D990
MKPSPPDVPWGVIDRIVATVAPRTAARRYAARVAIANLRRGYDAAARGRGTDGWRAGSTAADAEIAVAGGALRDRMRDLVRNDPLAAKAVQVLVSNIVGTGIRPRAAAADPALNKLADDLWKRWAPRADADGHTDFHGLTALAVREMIEGGEVFALRHRRRASDRLAAPVQIQPNEADHLDGAKFDNRPDGGRIVQGIEYDALGRRRGYWMFPDHPGDAMPVFGRRFESLRVGADGVAHLFERQRVQNRGVPWGVPAMRALRELGDWQTAELVRKKIEASMVGFVFGADEDQQSMAPVVQDADGNRIEQFEPGLIGYVRNGKDIKFSTPASTSGIYEWNQVQQHIISAGFRVPYELMTGDLSQVNFASSRVGLHEFRRMVEAVQWQVVIPMFCQRIWDWVMEAAWTAGALPQPEIAVEWAPPRFESVNPLQDVTADLMEVRAGFSTPAQQIARRGYDPREVVEEWQKYAALFDQLGLIFDADPRRVSRAGLAQAVDATDRDPPTEEQ